MYAQLAPICKDHGVTCTVAFPLVATDGACLPMSQIRDWQTYRRRRDCSTKWFFFFFWVNSFSTLTGKQTLPAIRAKIYAWFLLGNHLLSSDTIINKNVYIYLLPRFLHSSSMQRRPIFKKKNFNRQTAQTFSIQSSACMLSPKQQKNVVIAKTRCTQQVVPQRPCF